ncbi:hypothetical protein MKEN_01228100 [Mycena kentingensis (nom. inval.)]|nr:hypothetical protein MKEN_01228100 [Mycena kentingensis (nom. inval.)]
MSTTTVLALFIFPVLSALAFNQIILNASATCLFTTLEADCPATLTPPYRIPYTSVPPVDSALCALVAFFQLTFTPEVQLHLEYFLASILPLLAFASLEAVRPERHFLLAFPIIYGFGMRLIPLGALQPIYWLIFILTGSHRRRTVPAGAGNARAIALGLLAGYVLPSLALFHFEGRSPSLTAFWAVFALCQSLAQAAASYLLPVASTSGYRWTQALYLLTFAASSFMHITTMLSPEVDLEQMFVPSVSPRFSAPKTLQILDLLQWDIIITFASTWIGSLWFAESTRKAITILWPGRGVCWRRVVERIAAPKDICILYWYREGKLFYSNFLHLHAHLL